MEEQNQTLNEVQANESSEQSTVNTQTSAENKEGVVEFKKPYTFEGKEYTSIDLSGIDDLSGNDLLEADKIYSASGQFSPVPELTLAYTFAIASRATKLPLEFFNNLPAREALKVKNEVIRFLNDSEL
ncbi:hypothetical protein NST81_02935 [Bacillus sp. FSL W8-0223]|uniref:hypothetical protein n=1 Tax=Bacillus sp. FSL W8-0223 TaxID=2954595 RepID=UPI0030F98A0B